MSNSQLKYVDEYKVAKLQVTKIVRITKKCHQFSNEVNDNNSRVLFDHKRR